MCIFVSTCDDYLGWGERLKFQVEETRALTRRRLLWQKTQVFYQNEGTSRFDRWFSCHTLQRAVGNQSCRSHISEQALDRTIRGCHRVGQQRKCVFRRVYVCFILSRRCLWQLPALFEQRVAVTVLVEDSPCTLCSSSWFRCTSLTSPCSRSSPAIVSPKSGWRCISSSPVEAGSGLILCSATSYYSFKSLSVRLQKASLHNCAQANISFLCSTTLQLRWDLQAV